jgi:hypothetical protein
MAILSDVLDFRRWFGREVARLAAERAAAEDLKLLEENRRQGGPIRGWSRASCSSSTSSSTCGSPDAAKNRVMKLLVNTIRGAVLTYAPFSRAVQPAWRRRCASTTRSS